MSKEKIQKILKRHNLRVTDCRLSTLDFLNQANRAVTPRDLEDNLTSFDRVTLYRTLHSFVKNGIVHTVPDDSGNALYALCHDSCEPGHHHDDHLHFKCKNCGKTECIHSDFTLPLPQIKNYQVEDIQVILTGICDKCV